MASTSSRVDIGKYRFLLRFMKSTDDLVTSIANIMADDSTAVEVKIRIYFSLGLKNGNSLDKLKLDSSNDAWMFFHGMMEMHLQRFANVPLCIKRLLEVLKDIGLVFCANEIQKLYEEIQGYTKPSSEKKFLRQPLLKVEGNCPSFIGRSKELEKLEKLVFSNDTNSGAETGRLTLLTSVSGMGGIGKTMLARKFSNIFRDKHSENVAWIPCDTLNLAQSAFTDIAKKLNLDHQKEISLKELANCVYDLLGEQPKKSLFIFDNLDDPDADWTDDILPSRVSNIYGLITSRRRDILPKYNTLKLDVFSIEDALELVTKHLPDLSSKLATNLTEELGCFPLALRIATAHIARSSVSSEDATIDYIKFFTFEREKVRKLRNADMDGYSLTTQATLKISLDKIGQIKNGDAVRGLLGLMSFLQPDAIKKELVVEIFSRMKKTKGPRSLYDSLEILDMYSFITTEGGHGYYYYKIHRLVQKLMRFELKQEEKFFIVQVVVDTLCDSDDDEFFGDGHAKFILEIMIEESAKLSSDKTFICEMLHRLLKAVTIKYEYEYGDSCPGFNKIADNFIKRHLLNGSDTNFQLIPHYFNQMQHEKDDEPGPVMKTFLNGIYDQTPIEDPIISIVLLFYLLFEEPYSKTPNIDFTLLEKICGMGFDEINGKILPLEENGVISRMCTDWNTKVSSESKNDSDESNQILYEGIQQNTTGSAKRTCPENSYHFSNIGNFFEHYLRKNVSRINLSLIDTILSLGVSLDLGIAVPLHLLHFKNNAPATSKYLIGHNNPHIFQVFDYKMDKNKILEMQNLVSDITYGDLYSMIFHTAFNYVEPDQIYENVNFAIDVLNLLAKQRPITKEFIIRISPLLSGKIFSHTEDYELPDELKQQQDKIDELTEFAFFSYLTKNSKYCYNEFLTIAPKVGKTLITIGYGYEDDSQHFYLNPLVSCVLVASATIEEQFKFYQYVVRNSKCGGFGMRILYWNTWFLLYEKLLQHENLEFVEDDLLFPLGIFRKVIRYGYPGFVGHKLVESFSGVLHSVRLATNPVNINWKKDLTQCFELLKMDNSLSFSEKLEELIRASIYSHDFVSAYGLEKTKLRDNPVLLRVINKFRSFKS